jgi:hypothetical protein
MDAITCSNALRFGWSSRFNQRNSHGRYGMGLPNASLSQARRIEILTSRNGAEAWTTYLDADEFSSGTVESIANAKTVALSDFRILHPFKRGTTVSWQKCDRLESRYLGPLARRLGLELGRLFRFQLWAGKRITLNGDAVKPLDPLFARKGCGLTGATPFGPELGYEVTLANRAGNAPSSVVKVRFTELPIDKWYNLSNKEKNESGIAKGASVSVVRAGREIDYGWFFMGQKRRENYDDWWRCEIQFEPHLDELFGVTHTKQEIHPDEKLCAILTPDIERTARELNARARRAFLAVKAKRGVARESERLAERFDKLIEPPARKTKVIRRGMSLRPNGRVGGLEYRVYWKTLDQLAFYVPSLDGGCLKVILNEQHPFIRIAHAAPTGRNADVPNDQARRNTELAILAAARAEVLLTKKDARLWAQKFRESWSNILAKFLS